MIKIIRITKGIKYLKVRVALTFIKTTYQNFKKQSIEEIIRTSNDEKLKVLDLNKIEEFLYISFCLKAMRLFIIIASISYFTAMFFKIIIELEEDFYGKDTLQECTDGAIGYFKGCYDLDGMSMHNEIIILLYFTFTTLSTVGFGDFNPKSNLERLVISFVMLFGVAVFSIIMGQFIDMLSTMKDFYKDFEEGEKLAKFFGILKTFNRGDQIDIKIKRKIEHFFDYKWVYEKNNNLLD